MGYKYLLGLILTAGFFILTMESLSHDNIHFTIMALVCTIVSLGILIFFKKQYLK